MNPRIVLISPIPEFDMIVRDDILKVHTTVDPFTGSSVTYREPIALNMLMLFLEKINMNHVCLLRPKIHQKKCSKICLIMNQI